MAKLNQIEYFKRALLDFITEADPLYSMLQWVTESMMQLEAEQKVGVEKGTNSPTRTTHFSGTRLRRFDTRLGTMYLLVPKLRDLLSAPYGHDIAPHNQDAPQNTACGSRMRSRICLWRSLSSGSKTCT